MSMFLASLFANRSCAGMVVAVACSMAMVGCDRPHDAGQAAEDAAKTGTGDACSRLRERVASCLSNMKRGNLQLDFDPESLTDEARCRDIDRKFGLLAATVQCEPPAAAGS